LASTTKINMRAGLIILIAVTLTACSYLVSERGNGDRITKTFNLEPYDKIEVSGAYDVYLVQADGHDVTITVDENLMEEINIYVRGSRLIIESERLIDSPEGVKIEIPTNNIKELNISGASDIISKEPIRSEYLAILLSGAGKMDLKLDAGEVIIDLSGAALVYLEGVAKSLDVYMSGAGSLEADELEVIDCNIDISGVGSAIVNVSGTLDAQVSGLGKVEYIGDPESVRGDVSGIGNVEKANE
jgi:hypothetical protein